MLISSGVDSLTTKIISDCNTLLQCHMCNDRGFTTEGLKVLDANINYFPRNEIECVTQFKMQNTKLFQEHLKSHRGAKEFECSECSQRFCTSGGLSRHMKMHTYKQ